MPLGIPGPEENGEPVEPKKEEWWYPKFQFYERTLQGIIMLGMDMNDDLSKRELYKVINDMMELAGNALDHGLEEVEDEDE